MNERDTEMHEQNDPEEHARDEVDALQREPEREAEVGTPSTPSPSEPEMQRDQVPSEF